MFRDISHGVDDALQTSPGVAANAEYRHALRRLLGLVDHERIASVRSGSHPGRIRYHLGRMQSLLDELGNPHIGIPTVHIAGTKGKGSTSAMCASILARSGYRVGLFTSPHMHSFRERIQVGGEIVSEDEFAGLVDAIWPAVEKVGSQDPNGGVTMFEALTAMAFMEFRANANFQVLEVGLGGRLDTTNLASPDVCAITSLSLDHTSVLGDSIEAIAGEKAGIIKRGIPVVSAPQPAGAAEVIRAKCAEMGSPLTEVGNHITCQVLSRSVQGQRFEVQTGANRYSLDMPMLGDYQVENAAIAVGIVESLRDSGFSVPDRALQDGLASVSWPCRMEVLSRDPIVVCDGAHNPYSVAQLMQTLPDCFDYDRLVLVVGMSEDKNLSGMVEELARGIQPEESSHQPRVTDVVVARSRHPRSVSCAKLAALFEPFPCDVRDGGSVGDAMSAAINLARCHAQAGHRPLVLATGSLFIAAEAREALLGIEPELYPELEIVDGPP